MIRPEGRERLTQLPHEEEIADFTTTYGLWGNSRTGPPDFLLVRRCSEKICPSFSTYRQLDFSGICGIYRCLLLGSFRFCPRPGRLERTHVPPRSSQNENDTRAMDLLLGLCPSFKFSLGDVVELRCGSPPRDRCSVGQEGRERLPRLPLEEEIADVTPRPRAVGEIIDPVRISGSCLLAPATERRSGRALSQWYGKVLRFTITRSLPLFPVSHPAGSPGRFAQAQFTVSRKWPRLSPWSSEIRR